MTSGAKQGGTTDWQSVAFGVSLGALASFQQFKLPPALPLLFPEFGYSKTLAGSFMSIYAVAGMLISLNAGRELAKRGARPLCRLAFASMILGNLLWLALAEYGAAALLSRILESVGFALLAVVGAVLTTSSAAPKDKPLAVALWASWIPMGQILSTIVAVPFVSAGQWRPIWIATGAATIAIWIWGEKLLPKLKTAGIGQQSGAAGGKVKLAPLGRDRQLPLILASLLFAIWSGQYITYVTWLPQYLVENYGLDPGVAARAFLAPSALVIAVSFVAARMLKRGVAFGPLIVASTLLQAACWFAVPYTESTLAGVLSLCIYGGTSGITATAIFIMPEKLLGTDAPRGFAAFMAGRNIGVLVGPVLLAQLIALTSDWSAIPWVFGFGCVLCAALALYVSSLARRIAPRQV